MNCPSDVGGGWVLAGAITPTPSRGGLTHLPSLSLHLTRGTAAAMLPESAGSSMPEAPTAGDN